MSEKLDSSIDDKLSVVCALLKILCKSENNGNFVAPIRAHFFFRSVSGLWACSCPECSSVRQENIFVGRNIGRFYKRPRTICDCGNKVLEVLLCENCGEIYLGGYLQEKDGRKYITIEKPISEKFTNYGVLWKDKDGEHHDGWIRVDYDPVMVSIEKILMGNTVYIYRQAIKKPFYQVCALNVKFHIGYKTKIALRQSESIPQDFRR